VSVNHYHQNKSNTSGYDLDTKFKLNNIEKVKAINRESFLLLIYG
jgi:hypothetical protein